MATKKGIRLPTKIRLMSSAAYDIVTSVFRDTIPYRVRILVSDAAGASGRPFTIPTSLISTIVGVTVAELRKRRFAQPGPKSLKIATCVLQMGVALFDFAATPLCNHENRLRPRLHR